MKKEKGKYNKEKTRKGKNRLKIETNGIGHHTETKTHGEWEKS